MRFNGISGTPTPKGDLLPVERQGMKMNGPIAQIVALACYGNTVLGGRETKTFFPENSTCTFCDKVNFIVVEKSFLGKFKEKEVAKTPDEWFAYLKTHGVLGIRLSHISKNDPNISDRMSAGFIGGGGTWAMEVILPKGRSRYWVARWEVWNQNAPNKRIWRVTYSQFSEVKTTEVKPADLADVTKELEKAIQEIHTFSEKHDCSGFTKWFADALDTIHSKGKNLYGYHKDLALPGILSDEANMILHACQKSWVFGGMGSWNDMGFDGEEQKEYERVSDQHFRVVNKAIIAGANASYFG